MRKKFIYMTVCLLLLGFLLLNPVQARVASADGLLLWFHTLLPVLLPFCWAARVASMMLHNEDSFWQHLGLLFRKGECHG